MRFNLVGIGTHSSAQYKDGEVLANDEEGIGPTKSSSRTVRGRFPSGPPPHCRAQNHSKGNPLQKLFHDVELHQHDGLLRVLAVTDRYKRRRWHQPNRGPSTPESVSQEPEQVSPTYRICPKSAAQEPEPHGPL